MQARLVTIRDGKVVDVYPVEEDGTVYGRAGGDLVQIMDQEISKRHMKVYCKDGQWRILDLSSRNGTFVNGERIQSGCLKSGDSVLIGGTTLIFVAGETLPVSGQAYDVGLNAYRPTMPAVRPPSPGRG